MTKYRRYKDECDKLIAPFGMKMDTQATWDNSKPNIQPTRILELSMLRDVTFADLEGIAQLFGTKNINFSPCRSEYYGDFTHSKLTVCIDEAKLDAWFYTAEETAKQERKAKDAAKTIARAQLESDAKRYGYKLVKE